MTTRSKMPVPKLLLLSLAIVVLVASSVQLAYAADPDPATPVTVGYGGLTLNSPWTTTHWSDVWDLTQGDLTLSYTIDMTGLQQPGTWNTYDGSTSYTEVGLRGEGAGDFNPGPWSTYQGNCGGWMVSDSDTWLDSDGFTEKGNPNPDGILDLDDKHGLQASGGRSELDYDVLLSDPDTVSSIPNPYPWYPGPLKGAYGSWNNYGIWFDRDGVDPWQDNDPLTPAPGGSAVPWSQQDGRKTYDTGGIYDIVVTYHAIDGGLGVMFATVNGVPQGFYTTWYNGEPHYYPAGLSFKGDMKHMQVFAGLWAPNASYGPIVLSDITVNGYAGVSDPLVPDFTYAFASDVLSPGEEVQFTDATSGGMPPYTYAWNFGDGATSTAANPTHTYAAAGTYNVTLTVTPFRCVPKTVTKQVVVCETGYLDVAKFYDANFNGVWDEGELELTGWKVTIDGEEYFTPVLVELPIGTHTVTEAAPIESCWMSTTPTSVEVTVEAGYGPDMYAEAYTAGDAVAVKLDPYNPPNHALRLNPANVLGAFDAVQGDTNLNQRFFGVASQTWTDYTFEDDFWNVDGVPDIEFAEVTWGSWHTEAALVYLTGAYVKDGGDVVPYGATDNGIGYYAGIVWNKIGILGLSAAAREAKAQEYAASMGVTRSFTANGFYQDGNFGISQFNLPGEVVYATGVTLVDITPAVYAMVNGYIGPYAYPSGSLSGLPNTFLDVAGSGRFVIATSLDPFAYAELDPGTGNTDGYDLDAIRVHQPKIAAVEFGNLCLGAGGGLTPGFWSNKNGAAAFETIDGALAALCALNLKDAAGCDFDPASYKDFKAWLLARNAIDMRYQLSAHLAAMTLNVMAGFVDEAAIVYAGPELGFMSIAELMDEANAALGDPCSERLYLEQLKNALDKANNNCNFVQEVPCGFSF